MEDFQGCSVPEWAVSASGLAVPDRDEPAWLPDPSLNSTSGRRGRLIGSLAYILADLGRGTGPRGEKMAAACPGADSQDLATILVPAWAATTCR